MKTTVKKLENNKVQVSVAFEDKEVDAAIAKKYREIASKYKFPGFRKGKAPRPVVDSVMGKDGVAAQATDDLINNNYPISVDDAGIYPAGQPDFGKDQGKILEQGKKYSFKYTIEVEPEYELKNDDPVKISLPPEEATEKEIKAQIDQFREHFAVTEDAPASTKAKADSTVTLKIEATDDKGENIENLTNDALKYHLGSGFLPESFEKEVVGMKKGDKKEFSIDMPKEPTVYTTALKDKTKKINFKLEIKAVQKKALPKVDDEWVKTNMGFETVEELKKQITEQINREKQQQIPLVKENKALVELVKRIDGKPSKVACEKKEAELLQDFFTQLQQSGMTFDQYLAQMNIEADKFKEDLKKQAEDVCLQDLALDAYAKAKKIKVTIEDIENEFKLSDPKNWKNLLKDWTRRGEIHTVRKAILRMKAAKKLVEEANVTIEKEGK